jgi:hypothetical protein
VLRAERRSPGSQTPRALRGLSRAGTEANATTVRSRPAPRSAWGGPPRRQAREARSVGPIAWTRRTLADALEASSRRRVVPTRCRRLSHRWRPGGSHLVRGHGNETAFHAARSGFGTQLSASWLGRPSISVVRRRTQTAVSGSMPFGDGSGAGTSASSRMSCSAVRHHHRTVITTPSAGRRGKAERADVALPRPRRDHRLARCASVSAWLTETRAPDDVRACGSTSYGLPLASVRLSRKSGCLPGGLI